MSEAKTIRVNRVVNTTSGQNNQTSATPRRANAPRRIAARKAAQRPSNRQGHGVKPISIAIHNIFKPVNTFAPQAGGKRRGFKRTGRKAAAARPMRMQQPNRRPVSRPVVSRPVTSAALRPRMATAAPVVRPMVANRPSAAVRPVTRRGTRRIIRKKRKSFKVARRSFKSNKRLLKANRRAMVRNRAASPRRMTSTPARRVVRTSPARATTRPALRYFGRKRR